MKKTLIAAVIAALPFFALSQNDGKIVIGKIDTVFSDILKENRKIWVYTPDMTASNGIPDKRYPVLYLLDGDAHFTTTVGMVHQLSQANGNAVLPEMIVVGITHTNRIKELTPSLGNGIKADSPFVRFLESELMPYVEKTYNTAPYKLIIGHSLGGLMAIDLLTNKPDLFNSYIAIDPSMWYMEEQYLNHTLTQLPTKLLDGKRLFVGVANTMPKGMVVSDLASDKSNETQHIRAIFKLLNHLKTYPNKGLKYAHEFYEKESHVSVPLICQYDGLRFVFDYYQIDASEKDFLDSTAIIANKYKQHYNAVSKELGYRVMPPEAFINYLGYDALGKKQYDKANALFELNIENYPNNSNSYDALADFFASKRDTATAIVNYKKSLSILYNENTSRKMEALNGQKNFALSAEALMVYAGDYLLETYMVPIKLRVKEGALWAIVEGSSDSEFVPISKDVFTVRNKEGYLITFQMEGKKPVSFVSQQPNGVFKAILKK